MQQLLPLCPSGFLVPLCLLGPSLGLKAEAAVAPHVVLYDPSTLRGPYPAGGPYAVGHYPPLSPAHAEAAMPPARGRRNVLFGAALLLLLLSLTVWRVEGRVPAESWKSGVKSAQDKAAEVVNKPFTELNKQLERHGHALSARLVFFMTSLVFLVSGVGQILLSARQRHSYKRVFPVLNRAPSMKMSSALSLLIAAAAFYGLALAAVAAAASSKAAATAAVAAAAGAAVAAIADWFQLQAIKQQQQEQLLLLADWFQLQAIKQQQRRSRAGGPLLLWRLSNHEGFAGAG
ncbi:hypothetical protein Esti_005753 [Eimeria stiedai]